MVIRKCSQNAAQLRCVFCNGQAEESTNRWICGLASYLQIYTWIIHTFQVNWLFGQTVASHVHARYVIMHSSQQNSTHFYELQPIITTAIKTCNFTLVIYFECTPGFGFHMWWCWCSDTHLINP